MQIEKIKGKLVFTDEERGHIEYDLATKAFQKKNKKGVLTPIKNVNSFFVGTDARRLIDCFVDKNYGRYVDYVLNKEGSYQVTNMGTVLGYLSHHPVTELYFAMGIKVGRGRRLTKAPSMYPKDVLRVIREKDLVVDSDLERVFSLELQDSCAKRELATNMIRHAVREGYDNKSFDGVFRYIKEFGNPWSRGVKFLNLVTTHGYEYKRLMDYLFVEIDRLEAIDYYEATDQLKDYASMASELTNGRFDKYPRYLKTTHDITARTHRAFKQQIDEDAFKKTIDMSLEFKRDGFEVVVPKSSHEIKMEGVNQNNCVGSYIKSVIEGRTKVAFMRRSIEPNDSYITLEIAPSNTIVQAKRAYNTPIGVLDRDFLEKYAQNKKLKIGGRL